MSEKVAYRVIGQREVLDHKPGQRFEAELDPVQEARLVAGGHIKRIESKKKQQTNDVVESDEKE